MEERFRSAAAGVYPHPGGRGAGEMELRIHKKLALPLALGRGWIMLVRGGRAMDEQSAIQEAKALILASGFRLLSEHDQVGDGEIGFWQLGAVREVREVNRWVVAFVQVDSAGAINTSCVRFVSVDPETGTAAFLSSGK
jgi:hypothetical protein